MARDDRCEGFPCWCSGVELWQECINTTNGPPELGIWADQFE